MEKKEKGEGERGNHKTIQGLTFQSFLPLNEESTDIVDLGVRLWPQSHSLIISLTSDILRV
jgi:hypothetical protein